MTSQIWGHLFCLNYKSVLALSLFPLEKRDYVTALNGVSLDK